MLAHPIVTISWPSGILIIVIARSYRNCQVQPGSEFIPIPSMNETHMTQWRRLLTTKVINKYLYFQLKTQIWFISLIRPYTINDSSRLSPTFINIRDVFRTYDMRNAEAHTHPDSAVIRSAMSRHMAAIAHQSGYVPYHVSRARSDSFDGNRFFYHMKDLTITYQNDPVPENAVLIFTDVDYYADMNKWLALWKPILMYTFVPEAMSANRSEYSYHFEDNVVVYHVKGGATYTHQLWVYEGDTLTITNDGTTYTFHVDQRNVPGDPDHRYICLLPASKIKYPQSLLVNPSQEGLRRFENKGYLYDPITDKLSIRGSSKHHSINITGLVYNAVKARIANKISPPIIADIERILQANNINDSAVLAPLLFNYIDAHIEKNVVFTSDMVSYHPIVDGAMANEDGDPMGEQASSNLVFPGAAFPTNSHASDLATIEGRVVQPSNTRVPPNDYNTHANDFLSQLIRRPGVGTPYTIAQVEHEQDTAQQRARTEAIKATVSLNSSNRLQAFVKAEPYSTCNSPRNITTMSADLTTMMSCFTYPFKEQVLKMHKFYSPGLSPTDIANRISEITADDNVLTTDYARFDGSISEWLQKSIVRAAYNRWLKTEHKGEFLKWFEKVFKRKAMTRHGVRYDPGWGTRSGSPITTDGNTMINAFVMYVAFRKCGLSIHEAYNHLGLYCGDDGITRNIPSLQANLLNVVRELGLTVETLVKRSGPYSYCGRLFVDPKLIPDSFQDLKRTLPKLHLVANGSETIEQRLTNKAVGYLVTDKLTPILGVWAQKVIELTKLDAKHCTHEEMYKMRHPWPQTDREALMKGVMQQLDMTSQEIIDIERMILSTTSLTQFPVIQEWDIETKITARRGDVLEHVRRRHNNQASDNATPTTSTQTTTNNRGVTSRDPPTSGATRTAPSQTTGEQQRTPTLIQPLAGGSGRGSGQPHSSTNQPAPTLSSETSSTGIA
ncbi:hypothetical protein 1, partial [Emilia sonchifolia noda-like virus]